MKIILNTGPKGGAQRHICTWVSRFSLSSRIWLSTSSYTERITWSCSLSRLREKRRKLTVGTLRIYRLLHLEEREGGQTCEELVPDCLAPGWSPVKGTLCGSGCLPKHWAAPAVLSGGHTTGNRTPSGWYAAHTHHDTLIQNMQTWTSAAQHPSPVSGTYMARVHINCVQHKEIFIQHLFCLRESAGLWRVGSNIQF